MPLPPQPRVGSQLPETECRSSSMISFWDLRERTACGYDGTNFRQQPFVQKAKIINMSASDSSFSAGAKIQNTN